jgi:hypothetical protein
MKPTREVNHRAASGTERRQRIERALLAVAAAIDRDEYDVARDEWLSLRRDLEAARSCRPTRVIREH